MYAGLYDRDRTRQVNSEKSCHSKVAGFTDRTDFKTGPLSVSSMGGPISGSPL